MNPIDPARSELVPLSEERLSAYLEFASSSFGPRSYQADERYVRWLYDESPHGAMSDCALIACDERIIGCMHKFRLTWQMGREQAVVATAHNLFVDPDCRNGPGVTLILSAMGGEAAVFVPGAAGSAGLMYEKLRWHSISCQWHRRLAVGVPGVLRAGGHGSGIYEETRKGELLATSEPDADTIDACVAALNLGARESTRPVWTRESLVWRFFHPLGPRHLLARSGDGTFAIFSCGMRKRVRIARLIDGAFADRDRFTELLRWATRLLARRGAMVLWSYSSQSELNGVITDLGWKSIAPARSFLFHRKAGAPEAVAINASAGDFGFESILDRSVAG